MHAHLHMQICWKKTRKMLDGKKQFEQRNDQALGFWFCGSCGANSQFAVPLSQHFALWVDWYVCVCVVLYVHIFIWNKAISFQLTVPTSAAATRAEATQSAAPGPHMPAHTHIDSHTHTHTYLNFYYFELITDNGTERAGPGTVAWAIKTDLVQSENYTTLLLLLS